MSVKEKLTALADSIRAKAGTTDLLTLDQMTTTISELKTGGANEPYTEEEYDSNGELINVRLYGHNHIRNYAFTNCPNLALSSLPPGITSIGKYAFQNCSKLDLTSLPSGVTSIGIYAFVKCSNLALTSLPPGITSIGMYAFSNCSKLALTSLPSSVTDIENNAFDNCTSLTTLTFKGKPSNIRPKAFNMCGRLLTINVPWAAGEVANAPWGAKNATINYNYTGE